MKIAIPLIFLTLAFPVGAPTDAASAISSVPDNATWREETIRNPMPKDYKSVLIWFQAVTISSSIKESINNSRVVIDYEKVIEKHPDGSEKTVYRRNYDGASHSLPRESGGLYLRNPWFGGNDYNEKMTNSFIRDGNFTIEVGQKPNRVAHWWTDRVSADSKNKYLLEIRYRVDGMAALQFGSDWWRDQNVNNIGGSEDCTKLNNCEAWVSGWFENTGGKFVTVKVPFGDKPPIINNLSAKPTGKGNYELTASMYYPKGVASKNFKFFWDLDGDGKAERSTTTNVLKQNFAKGSKPVIYCRVSDDDGMGAKAGPLKISVP